MTKRIILQNACGKSLVVESAFDKIAWIETLGQQRNWKEAFTKEVFLQLPQNFHYSERCNMRSPFCKIARCVLQYYNLIKVLVQHRLFFQISLLIQLGYSTFIPETQPARDVFEMSQSDLHWDRHLKDLSETSQKTSFCDVFKTFRIHLKNDVFFVTSLRRFKYISKHVLFVTSLRRLKYISKKMCFLWPL